MIVQFRPDGSGAELIFFARCSNGNHHVALDQKNYLYFLITDEIFMDLDVLIWKIVPYKMGNWCSLRFSRTIHGECANIRRQWSPKIFFLCQRILFWTINFINNLRSVFCQQRNQIRGIFLRYNQFRLKNDSVKKRLFKRLPLLFKRRNPIL